MRVELEPDKLNSYGIGLEDVRAAVSAANADSAKGDIDQGDQRFEVLSNDQATKAADYQDLVIAYRNGAPVLLHDVADGGGLQREHPQCRPLSTASRRWA